MQKKPDDPNVNTFVARNKTRETRTVRARKRTKHFYILVCLKKKRVIIGTLLYIQLLFFFSFESKCLCVCFAFYAFLLNPNPLSSAYRVMNLMNLSHSCELRMMYRASMHFGFPFTNFAFTSTCRCC